MIRYFATHPTAANLLMVGLIAIGLVAMPAVKRETFPDIPARQVEARVVYPGAAAEDVEGAICRRIEDVIDTVAEVDETRCEAREGVAIARIEMREGGDIDTFLDDVKTEVEAIDTFPDQAEAPVIRLLERTDLVATVAITGPMSLPDLKAFAEAVKDRLLRIAGVSKVTLEGFSDHQIRIEVSAATLRQFGLSIEALADTVAGQSVDLPAGAVETRDSTVLLRFADERRTPRQFEDLVVLAAPSGAEVRLGDIATITDRFKLDEAKNLFNGRRAASLIVEKAKGDDTLDVVDALKAFIEDELARAPPDVAIALTRDISSIVRDRLNMLLRNGAQGLLLVFLTMWLFFSFRFSFWVAAGLPVSFLGTIALMAVFGYSFDMISMVGLLIAVGLLMDDAIVLSENIAVHMKQGKPALEAAIEGSREVAPGVIMSFLTTICIFGGLAFMKGHLGDVLKVLPVVLVATLVVSLVEAFLILPHHLRHALRRDAAKEPPAFRRRFDAAIDWTREAVVGRIVDWAVDWRYLAVGLVIAVLLASVAMLAGGAIKFRAFPELEGNVLEVRILLPQGTPLRRTEEVVARIQAALERVEAAFPQPGGQPLVRNVGIRYAKNIDAFESGPHVATVLVDLLHSERRLGTVDEILGRWRAEVGTLPDVLAIKFTRPRLGPAGRAIEVRLLGDELGRIKAASLELQAWLGSFAGVHDLFDDLRPGKPEIRLRLRQGASVLGFTAAGIATQLRAAFQGKTAGEIQVASEPYEVRLRLAGTDRDSLADLDDFVITAPNGSQVPLSMVADLEAGRGWGRIHRIDGRRAVTIQGEVDTARANADEIVAETRRRFLPELARRFPDVRVVFRGQARESARTGASLLRNFGLGALGIFLLLSFQFRSYFEPLVVMLAMPLGLIGAIWGHALMGLDLSMPSVVGLASLSGVVVNDSILLVEFIKRHRRAGKAVPDAARLAARQRFRAIALTSLTTVAGLTPLLAETSLQAQVLIPLVTSLAFGLTSGTLLVLVVVPALYVILDDFGLTQGIGTDDTPASPPTPRAV